MAVFSAVLAQQRRLILAILCAAALFSAGAADAQAKIDRPRAEASLALASHYWAQAGLDALPPLYDRARFKKALGGEDDPYNVVAAIAVATLNANPGREDGVFKYLNQSLLPFALTHKPQFLCLAAEVFYNSQSSTDEIKAQAQANQSDSGMPIAFIQYAYFLIKTEPEREKLKLVVPANSGIPETIATFKKTLSPKGGSLIPDSAIRLDCDHQ